MPRLLRTLPLLAAAALAAPAAAQAGFFAATPIDQSPEITSAGDLDVARDGTGGVAYLKREDGVDHVFVSRFVNGAFGAPERLDAGLPAAASQPVVAAADGERLAVAYVSGGQLFVAYRAAGSPGFAPPQLLATAASNPAIDMSINGVTYVSFTAPGASAHDVRVARLARRATQFEVLPDPLDIDGARDAGDGAKRSQVAVSADGTAVVVWGEDGADGRTHVHSRRVFGARLSVAPQDITLNDLGGTPAQGADLPDIDIEDDSSYAWAAFRQQTAAGPRTVARRLVGSQFEAPADVGPTGGFAIEQLTVELNGRGEGIATSGAGPGGVHSALLHDNTFFPALTVGNGVGGTLTGGGVSENNDAFVGWTAEDASVRIRPYDIDPARRDVPPPGPEAIVSAPELGPVLPALGFELAVDRAGDAVATFVQDAPGGRVLAAGTFDRAPGTFRTYTTSKVRKFARPPLSWSPAFELWGPISYRVEVDGAPVGETTDTKLTTLNPIPDGDHTWRVVATDRRGQTSATPTRTLRVDATPPEIAFKVTGKRQRGKPVTLKAQVADGSLATPAGSGVARVAIDWGDRTAKVNARTAKHRYARAGKYTIRVSAADRAGGTSVKTLRITVKK